MKFDDVAAMGYKAMHVSLVAMRVMMVGAFHEMAGFPRIKALEKRFLPAEEVQKKYEGSVGL